MTADAEAASRLWTERVVQQKLAVDANKVVNELERPGGHARSLLEDPRMALPELAGMRARLLSAVDGSVEVQRLGNHLQDVCAALTG
jgi:hypothetical protein